MALWVLFKALILIYGIFRALKFHVWTLEVQKMKLKMTSAKKSTFCSSRAPSYAIRPFLPSTYAHTIYVPPLTTFTPPTPRYKHNRPPSTTFVRLPPKTMSSPPPSQPPQPVPAAPKTPVYDHDDPKGIVKYLRAVEIAEGRPDPLPPPHEAVQAEQEVRTQGADGGDESARGAKRSLVILTSVPRTLHASLTPSTQPHLRRHNER